ARPARRRRSRRGSRRRGRPRTRRSTTARASAVGRSRRGRTAPRRPRPQGPGAEPARSRSGKRTGGCHRVAFPAHPPPPSTLLYDIEQIRAHYRKVIAARTPDYWERFDQHMLEKRPHVRMLLERTFQRLFPEKVGRLLDVGCGTCFYFPLLARHAEALIGVDICIPVLEQAQQLIAAEGLTNGSVRESSALDLPFEDRSVDVVHSWDFLHHVPDVRRAISEIDRVLAPGGRYVALEPNLLNPSIFWYHA